MIHKYQFKSLSFLVSTVQTSTTKPVNAPCFQSKGEGEGERKKKQSLGGTRTSVVALFDSEWNFSEKTKEKSNNDGLGISNP